MIKTAFLLGADSRSGSAIGYYLLERGITLTTPFSTQEQADSYMAKLPSEWHERCIPVIGHAGNMEQIEAQVKSAAEGMQGLDLYIHGTEWLDEMAIMENSPVEFANHLDKRLRELFLYSRAAGSVMARKREGQIIVPMLSDTLHYTGFPSSPVYNQGAISFVKSLAKELSPFRVSVNAFIFGYYRSSETEGSIRENRKQFEIYTLKPHVPELEEAVKGLGVLLDYGRGMSGQTINFGYGIPSLS